MEKLKGFLIILLCNLAGNLATGLANLPVPGAVLGMLLLLVLLLTKLVRLKTVEPAASLLTGLMLIFILPDGVNLMNSFHKFEGIVLQVLVVAILSTLLSILSASGTAQLLRRKSRSPGEGSQP